jgi:hypothetical protein
MRQAFFSLFIAKEFLPRCTRYTIESFGLLRLFFSFQGIASYA